MATVSQLCEAIAHAANMPADEVKKYARALISSGDLPKATGRSVPKTDFRQRAKLILAIAASERPADCVKAMRDRYEAVSRFPTTDLTAGEVLAGELRELAAKIPAAFQKWNYSTLEVSRSGMPRVQFRINENLKHFAEFKDTAQPEFLGGPWLAKGRQDKFNRLLVEHRQTGFVVSAYVPGNVLIAAAFGSIELAKAAKSEILGVLDAEESAGAQND